MVFAVVSASAQAWPRAENHGAAFRRPLGSEFAGSSVPARGNQLNHFARSGVNFGSTALAKVSLLHNFVSIVHYAGSYLGVLQCLYHVFQHFRLSAATRC